VSASDLVIVDTGELRTAAAALRRAAAEAADLRLRVPSGVDGAPDWLGSRADPDLAQARRELDELSADLRTEADALEARADAVEGSERRWADLADGAMRCGCVLPSGELVAQPMAGGTAISAASGPGIDVAVGAVGLAAAGGGGLLGLAGDFTVYPAPLATMPGTLGMTVIGGGSPLGSGITITQPAPTPGGAGSLGYSTIGGQGIIPVLGQDYFISSQPQELSVTGWDLGPIGMFQDHLGADIAAIMAGGGSGTSVGATGLGSMTSLLQSMDRSATIASSMAAGSDVHVYERASGGLELGSQYMHPGETPYGP